MAAAIAAITAWLTSGSSASVPLFSGARSTFDVSKDDFQTIRVFAERDNSNIVHWSRFEEGGHFAALEVPSLLTSDIRTFFGEVRAGR